MGTNGLKLLEECKRTIEILEIAGFFDGTFDDIRRLGFDLYTRQEKPLYGVGLLSDDFQKKLDAEMGKLGVKLNEIISNSKNG